jgi:peptide/nickel transport system permease protein
MSSAIGNKDYPVIEGCVIIISISVCLINLLVDLAYAYIDPRIKAQYISSSQRQRKKMKPAGHNGSEEV